MIKMGKSSRRPDDLLLDLPQDDVTELLLSGEVEETEQYEFEYTLS